MGAEITHTIWVGMKEVKYKEYPLQPSDRNKSLAQIAREQLGVDKLVFPIYKKVPSINGSPIYADVADPLDPNLTLLLPPSDFASFVTHESEKVRTTPRIENNNILYEAPVSSTFLYKKNSVIVDITNDMVWADVSQTDPKRNGGRAYWVCVKYGNTNRTTPPINGPVN